MGAERVMNQEGINKDFQNTQPVITISRLSKWYGQVLGLNDVSVSIYPGITGLLGPNGAGKSTMLKILTGQIRPRIGDVRIKGEKIWNNPQLMANLGYCPEQDAFYEDMTGFEFVRNLLLLNGFDKSKAGKLASDAIKTVDLVEVQNRKIKTYSKGMRQRAKLAQSLAHDPEILILDEPLLGTDPIGRQQIIELLLDLEKKGKTVLVSSHILHEIERLTDQILLINHGRLLALGQVHEIRALIDKHPHNIWVETRDPRKLASLLVDVDFVTSVRIIPEPAGLYVETPQPEEFYLEFPKILVKENITISHMGSTDDNLDAVFRYLVG
jgi:ABC-2 type transport system ATP-binding protein